MRFNLQVLSGPDQGRQQALPEQGTLRVGRVRSLSDLAVADTMLAPQHFTLAATPGGAQLQDLSSDLHRHSACADGCFLGELRNERCPEGFCRVHDMSGHNHVYLNGEQVHEAALKHADVIVAGTTAFRLSSEDDHPQPEPPAGAEPLLTPAQQHNLLAFIEQHRTPLYGIVDAARDPGVLRMLQTHDELYYSLYDGKEGEQLADVAPYLVQLSPSSTLLRHFVAHGWGNAWGVLLYSPLNFKATRRHLRRFLMVDTEGGEQVYFRFYDPRVLREFLPTCDDGQLTEFVGEFVGYVVEQSDPGHALLFGPDGRRFTKRAVDLQRGA